VIADARAELPPKTAPMEQPAVTVDAAQPTPAPPADVAPDQGQREALVAAFRAANADRVDNNNVVIADDSVNVDPSPSGSEAQAEPPPRATVGLVQAAAAPSAAAMIIDPLRAAFGWILIGLGLVVFAGGLFLGARSPHRRPQYAGTISR
jgi:hypothetical protein